MLIFMRLVVAKWFFIEGWFYFINFNFVGECFFD